METKGNKLLVIIVVILSILVLGMGSFLIYDKIIKNKDNVNPDNRVAITKLDLSYVSKNQVGEKISTYLTVAGNNIDIKYTIKEYCYNETDCQYYVGEIDFNGHLYKTEDVITKIEILENLFILGIEDLNHDTGYVISLNLDGDVIWDSSDADYGYSGMKVYYDEFKIEDTKLIVNAKRWSEQVMCEYDLGSNIFVTEENYEEYKNEIAEGDFSFEYLGNNVFGKATIISSLTIEAVDQMHGGYCKEVPNPAGEDESRKY